MLDPTHDPHLRSWVTSANGHSDFSIQNLPLGIFTPPVGGARRIGIAIGDMVLDAAAAQAAGLFAGEARRAAEAALGATLNPLLALGSVPRRALRARVSDLLSERSTERVKVEPLLHPAANCTLHLPVQIGDYTDFYVGIHHAVNIGKQFRPDNPLLPNYKHIPIGYHGRASSVRPSGMPIRRPNGQTKAPEATSPRFGPCQRLDYELELGIWVGPGNRSGESIPVGEAAEHIAGFCLLNDWSARDIQSWEYQPLGPFLSKNFASTVSCWVVTPEALAPFRIPQPLRPEGDPAPLPYLQDAADQASGALEIELEVLLLTAAMRERGMSPHRLSASNAHHMYWTVAQMVAHHTCGGCDLRPGDLLGTGTISGPDAGSCGSILETTLGGRQPLRLETGEQRSFLEDGDEILMRARAKRDGFASIGFGECRAMIQPAQIVPSP
jgi:fumarylacetoacetase